MLNYSDGMGMDRHFQPRFLASIFKMVGVFQISHIPAALKLLKQFGRRIM
jgi:hypothetical protein